MRNPILSLFTSLVLVVLGNLNHSPIMVVCNFDPMLCEQPIQVSDKEAIKFALNFQFLSGELFLNGALGKGLDDFDPHLASGGPPPIGAQLANLDPLDRRIIEEFGYQEIARIRYLKEEGEIARPLIDLRKQVFAKLFDRIFGRLLTPSFDPYANSLNFFLCVNVVTYKAMVGLVGACPYLNNRQYREVCTGLLGVKAGQNAVIRAYLYQKANDIVVPYNITVAEFTNRVSTFSNKLGKCGIKDEGIEVARPLGAERRTESNILAADNNSLSYSRTPQELLRLVYGTGDEGRPGAFFPKGANGNIAKRFMRN